MAFCQWTRKAKLKLEILAFDVAEATKASAKCVSVWRRLGG
jgi:hypothetical protein